MPASSEREASVGAGIDVRPVERAGSGLDIAAANAALVGATAPTIVEWALERFGRKLVVAASMADTALVHVATTVDPDIEVVFLDTGFHFSETILTVRRAQVRYGLNLRVERPAPEAPDLFSVGVDGCCAARKVAVLDRALAGRAAWLTGLRRDDSPSRADAPIVATDRRGLLRIAPLADWTDADVAAYVAAHDLVVNPLLAQGYPSIGCWPCTEPVLDGSDPRAGRWRGLAKTECGLNL
jgi:phosphoadenosine phosphosulfate reductase